MSGPGALGRLTEKVTASLKGRRPPRKHAHPSDAGHVDHGLDDPAEDTSGTGGIKVIYAPELDGRPDPGEIVWGWVPFEEDPNDGKDRPVLVIGFDGDDLCAVQLSSKDHSHRNDHGDWVVVGRGPWDGQGRVSSADASRLIRLDPSTVRREGAILDRERFDLVLERVRVLHGWTD